MVKNVMENLKMTDRQEISTDLGQKTIPGQLNIEEITRIKISRVDHKR